jgi:hypothetical protein
LSSYSPGNADLSDEAAGVSNDGAKSENADIAASAGNGNTELSFEAFAKEERQTQSAFLYPPTSDAV